MRRWAFCFGDSNIVRSEPVFWLVAYDRSLGRLSGSAGLDSAGCCESKSAGLILPEHFSFVKPPRNLTLLGMTVLWVGLAAGR